MRWLGVNPPDPWTDQVGEAYAEGKRILHDLRMSALDGERWIEGEHFHQRRRKP